MRDMTRGLGSPKRGQKYVSLSLSRDTWEFINAALLEYAAVSLEKGIEANAKRADELRETIRYQLS